MKEKEIVKKIENLNKKEEQLVIENMPVFERGIVEAAMDRESALWKDLSEVFSRHSINPSVITAIQSDNQSSRDPHRPALVCAGVKVSLSYIVSPMDMSGRDGSMPAEVIEEIGEIRKEKEALLRKLEEN
jgi:hypothetical protein